MLTSDFDYELPLERIAQVPVEPRDSSKLMVVDRREHDVQHRVFRDVVQYLSKGDLLVWNNSKVFKARLHGTVMLDTKSDGLPAKETTGKILDMPTIEVFLMRPTENVYVWKVLAKPGKKLRLGMKVRFADDFEGEVMLKEEDGTILMQFADDDAVVRAKANQYGEVPTPPYVGSEKLKTQNEKLEDRYQTVYAKHEGSVAAPTAGFHFTPELIEQLKAKGVEFAEVTLHVGLGTFLPVKVDDVSEHKMHSEWIEVTAKNADLINAAKAEGRRVIAVGTTTVRTLEGIAQLCHSDRPSQGVEESLRSNRRDSSTTASAPARNDSVVKAYTGDINIFITPGFEFKVIDCLITNFHLPKSTLIMLVSAFIGDREFTIECYKKAIEEKYRFYSFGDAMFIK